VGSCGEDGVAFIHNFLQRNVVWHAQTTKQLELLMVSLRMGVDAVASIATL
jgi:hypothetical protein